MRMISSCSCNIKVVDTLVLLSFLSNSLVFFCIITYGYYCKAFVRPLWIQMIAHVSRLDYEQMNEAHQTMSMELRLNHHIQPRGVHCQLRWGALNRGGQDVTMNQSYTITKVYTSTCEPPCFKLGRNTIKAFGDNANQLTAGQVVSCIFFSQNWIQVPTFCHSLELNGSKITHL